MNMVNDFFIKASHRLVLTSGIALVVYLFSIFFYTKIYPKKKISYLILLIGFSILPIISIFRSGSYESGDLNTHTTNLISFYQSLKDGILIPNWAGDLNATYGYPLFEFIYPLPYYIASFFHLLGFNFLNSVKALLITTYISSGIFMYLFLKNHTKEKFAFLGAILYLFAPYHLVDLHFRVAIGEITALAILPLSFYLIDKSLTNKDLAVKFITGAGISLLVLSHPAVSLLGFPLLIVYSIYRSKRKLPDYITNLIPHFIGLLLSAFYWLPVLFEGKFTQQTHQITKTLQFPSIFSLLYSKWRLGLLFQGPRGELSFALGYAHIAVLIFILYLIFFKKYTNKVINFFLIAFFAYLFLILKISKPVWLDISTLRKMQFPYRLLTMLVFTSSALGALISEKIKNKVFFNLIITIAIVTSILNWGNRKNTPWINNYELIKNSPLSTYQYAGALVASPKWRNYEDEWMKEIPSKHIESLNEDIRILSEKRSVNKHLYQINTPENTLIKENTFYFPGWELYIDGAKENIDYLNPDYLGIITFPLKEGEHFIELAYKDTLVRKYSKFISLSTLLASGMLLITTSLSKEKRVF